MMKKFYYFPMAALALFLNSCNDVDEELQELTSSEVITASVPTIESRTTANGLDILWSANDQIGVFKTKNSYTTDNYEHNCFTLVSGGEGKTTASFSAEMSNGVTNTLAYYPYLDGSRYDGTTLSLSIPTGQHYTDGCQMVMAGEFAEGSSSVSFKNAMALAVITVNNIPAGYTKAVLTAADSEKLNGAANVTFTSTGQAELKLASDNTAGSNSLTIEFGNNTDGDKTFYFAIPVDEYADGLKMTLEGENVATKIIGTLTDANDATKFTANANEFHTFTRTINDNVTNVIGVATADDLTAALSNGQSVKLTDNITLSDNTPLTVSNNVIIDLNGKTLSGKSTNGNTSYLINVNSGVSLTLVNGTVSFGATTPDTNWGGEGQPAYPGYANNTIRNYGTLVIDGATIENKTQKGGASYVIDNYDGGSLTINSGKIIQSGDDIAIRIFASSANKQNNVTINGGTITGRRGVWIQLAGSNTSVAPNVNLTITGGTLTGSKDTNNKLAIYSYSYGNAMNNVKIDISGGTFNGDVALTGGLNKDNIEALNITGGTFNGLWGDVYSYGEDELAAAAIKITGGKFSHLYPLTYMAGDNGDINVTLDKDLKVGDTDEDDMGGPILIPSGNKVTLDLNGKTISQTSTTPVSVITNEGNLTIKDSSNGYGKIAFTFDGTVNNNVAANAISNRGTLLVEGGEISNTGTGNQIGYAIDNYNGSTLQVDGGKITASGSSYYDGIRLFCGSNETTVTVNNGEISSIWAQNPSANKATEVRGTVIINGGTVVTTYYENYTTVKVKSVLTTTVTPYGEGSDHATTTTEGEYTVYSFVHE